MRINEEDIDNFEVNDYLKEDLECECGVVHSTKLKNVIIEEGAIEKIPYILKKYRFNNVLIVSDLNTYKVAGKKISDILLNENIKYKECILKSKGDLIPNEEAVGDICIAMDENIEAIITVGTGTLNDLCKFISFKFKIPSIVVATAPSMDGFVSNGSALMIGGLKVSYKSEVPMAVVGDINILKDAPIEMILAGFGDIVGKYSALNDWRLSNLINKEYYCKVSYEMVKKSMEKCINNSEKIRNREPSAIKELMEALIITGIGMSFVGNSRPASGSEHHLAHYFEMKFLFEDREPVFHGRKVGMLTNVTLKLREMLLNYDINFDKAIVDARSFDINKWEKDINAIFKETSDEIIEISNRDKTTSIDKRIERINIIKENINSIKDVLKEAPTSYEIEEILKNVGAPYKLKDIKVRDDEIVDAICFAKEIRTRYTILTLLSDLGVLNEFAFEIQNELNEGSSS